MVRESDSARQKRILQHAQRSSSANSLRAMLDIARTRGLSVRLHEWDNDPMLLGTPAGAIDLRSGKPLEHPDPREYISKAVGCMPRGLFGPDDGMEARQGVRFSIAFSMVTLPRLRSCNAPSATASPAAPPRNVCSSATVPG